MARIVAAVAGGAALSLAFYPVNAGWLVWIAMLPVMAACFAVPDGKRRGWKGFALGWLAGFAFFALNVSWLGEVTSIGPYALASYLALYFAAFGAFAASWGRVDADKLPDFKGSLRLAFCHAALWGGLEWLRGWLLTGFGWNGLGVALHGSRVFAQAADILGVAGLSMLVIALNVLVWIAAQRLWRERKWLAGAREFAAAIGLLLLVSGYGVWRLSSSKQAEVFRLRALLVQLNIPQEAAQQLWTAEQVHIGYEEETEKALAAIKAANDAGTSTWQPDWLVWPETALTGRLCKTDDGKWGMWRDDLETLSQVRDGQSFTMLFGQNEEEGELVNGELQPKAKGRMFNSLVAFGADHSLQTFRKHHLVIFGETIPFIDQLPWLAKIYEAQSGIEYGGSFAEGESLEPLALNVRGTKLGVIPSVCFEDTVPRLVRKFVRNSPQVMVNVTNDGWFKQSPAALQHFANAKFRAIELRRPLLRCSNTGVSAAVDVTGSIKHPQAERGQILLDQNGSVFTRGWLPVDVDVPLKPAMTLYAIAGDWPLLGLSLTGLLWAFWRHKPRSIRCDA